jgi:FdhE protein
LPVETDKLIHHLEEKERKEGTLPQLLKLYQQLLRIQSEVEQKIASRVEPSLSREAISQRIQSGTPLIGFDELALDWPLLAATFAKIMTACAGYADNFKVAPDRLREIGADSFPSREAIKTWYEQHKLPAKALIKGIDRTFLAAVIQSTLKPFLIIHAKALIGSVDQERWRRGYCPICGGSPDFAYLDEERGSRWLLCSRCDTEWIFQRLQCPFCDTQDQNDLAYFTNDEGRYRLYVCEHCKHYLKTIDLRQAKSEVLLPLERLYTLDIDRQAREQGYQAYSEASKAPGQSPKPGRKRRRD